MKFFTSKKTRERSAAILRPPPRLKISEWAERDAYLPGEGNAEPGKYRLSRMPHQEEMLDDPLDPSVREVFWMMASQYAGKTLCGILICEYVICVLKRSLIMARDVKDRAKEWLRDKFWPTVRSTPCMEGLIKEPRKRGSESTVLSLRFPGGVFKAIGAKSVGGLRATSAGVILQDEIDAYVTTKEGDPCALIDRAAKTFADAWKIKMSTPTLKDFSRIHAGFLSGDQQYYFVPCVCCGAFQWLKTEQLKFTFTAEEAARLDQPGYHPNNYTWAIGDFPIYRTKDALYVCEVCHRGWSDQNRLDAYWSGAKELPAIVPKGPKDLSDRNDLKDGLRAEWRATAEFKGIRSRHLNGMYASIGLEKDYANFLHMFAEQFLAANKGGRETLMTWWNMFKCEPFEEPGEKLEWAAIKKRAEDYDPEGIKQPEKSDVAAAGDGRTPHGRTPEFPVQVVWINFGMDVHPDRVEILFWGWGEGQESWCLAHQVFFGDFDMPSMQERVWDFLSNKRFEHPVLGPMTWSAGGIDSGHQTKLKAVYQFCAKHRLANVFSLKGFEDLGGAVYERKHERVYGGVRLNLNTDYFKTMLFDRLRNVVPGPRFVHFPKERRGQFGDLFYAQLCSEKRQKVKMPRGGYVLRWVKLASSTRNEVLDMTVYAWGVYEVCRQEEWIARKWKEVREVLQKETKSTKEPENPEQQQTRAGLTMAPSEKKQPGLERKAPTQSSPPRPPGRRRIRIRSPFGRGY